MNNPTWTDRLKAEVPLKERAKFLTDLQALIESLRNDGTPRTTELLHQHSDLALAYIDEGPKKKRARAILN